MNDYYKEQIAQSANCIIDSVDKIDEAWTEYEKNRVAVDTHEKSIEELKVLIVKLQEQGDKLHRSLVAIDGVKVDAHIIKEILERIR